MVIIYCIYKGSEKVVEGVSLLIIIGFDVGVKVVVGMYYIVCV